MKKLFCIALALLALSCEKEGELTKAGKTVVVNNGSVLVFTGNLAPTSGISATGKIKLFDDKGSYKLRLEDVSITSGPDLKVYLSKTDTPTTFVNLGNFTGNGTSTYAIPNGLSFSEYQYVLIHCQQHNHLYATAKLIPNL